MMSRYPGLRSGRVGYDNQGFKLPPWAYCITYGVVHIKVEEVHIIIESA